MRNERKTYLDQMKLKIKKFLTESLSPNYINIQDVSHAHAGHIEASPNGETHFNITISSHHFIDKTKIERHKIVNNILKPCFNSGLHAASIKTLTPEEYEKS